MKRDRDKPNRRSPTRQCSSDRSGFAYQLDLNGKAALWLGQEVAPHFLVLFLEIGVVRMVELLIRHQDSDAHEISARIMEAVQNWNHAEELPDDMTLLLARCS